MQQILSVFPKSAETPAIRYGVPVLLLGSCFSVNLGNKLQNAGFQTLVNPFGTVFHPDPIARFLLETLQGTDQERLLNREDVWLSQDAGSEVYAMSREELLGSLKLIRADFKSALQRAQVLLVTFGSAHGYVHRDTGTIVANCHKEPAAAFTKSLSDVDAMVESWRSVMKLLGTFNPGLKIVFTVSPVRYSRDGWEENNRSKSRLFLLTEQLRNEFDSTYFPAYELVNDLLRDYRYFEADGVHPNALAISEVWKLFGKWFWDEATACIVDEAESLRRMEQHRILFPGSAAEKRFVRQLQEKRESFLSLHPYINW